jgi:alanine racemase
MSLRNNISKLVRYLEKEYVTHNRIEVSRLALLHNISVFKRLSGKQVIPVLKGNAYGHSIELVTQSLKGESIPYIAVDGYFEALRIRAISSRPVLVMGAILPVNFARLKYDAFTFVVHDKEAIDALGKTGKSIKVHLECNSGMNRYGAEPSDVAMLTKHILSYKNLELEGVMSHLADSDGVDPVTVEQAVAIFDSCVEVVRATGANPSIIHVAQSAGSLKAQSKYATAIRLGIGVYGINPFPEGHPLSATLEGELRPAMKLVSTIVQVIELEKGDKVSYNYTFTAPKKMRIGVLPVGYYEGVNRALSNKGEIKIGASYAPIVGRVCMNHTMISLDGIDAQVGDEVVVYSDNPNDRNAIDQIATHYNLFGYNLLTALNSDVRRVLVE